MDAIEQQLRHAPDRLDRPAADPLIGRLFPRLAQGGPWKLERTARALAALGDPQRRFRALHVGGTNGKGSVTATAASILTEAGWRSASYTSPHLCSFRERILVAGEPLSEDALLAYGDEVRGVVESFALTFFEAATVLAFHAFAREGVEAAAVEVGLGGRLDATNVLAPEVTAVTNVAMDHAEYLGSTLVEIAREKAGIMKPGRPFVTAETSPPILEVLERAARSVGAPFHPLAPGAVGEPAVTAAGTSFRLRTRTWGELDVFTPLVGAHQAVNAALAVEIFEHVPEALRPGVRELLAGVRKVRHRGRDELTVLDGRTWLFDVAHNPAGMATLVDTLERLDLPRPLVALVGVLGDKDWRAMLPPLLARVEAMVLAVPPTAPAERRWDPAQAAAALAGARPVTAVDGFAEAVAEAARRAGRGGVVVTGSIHTVGGAMAVLGLDPLG